MSDHLPHADIDAALHTLRDRMLAVETPRAVEDALLAACAQQQSRQHARKPRWFRRLSMPGWSAGMGLAGLAGAVFAVMLVLATPRPHWSPAQSGARPDDGADFIALVSAEHIAGEPAPQLIETDIARTALAALGVPLSPDNAGEFVRAQFLIGADGQPLALRLLPALSTSTPDRG